jgi:hypothetical protein
MNGRHDLLTALRLTSDVRCLTGMLAVSFFAVFLVCATPAQAAISRIGSITVYSPGGNKAGSMTIDVPANATLAICAFVGWNGVNGVWSNGAVTLGGSPMNVGLTLDTSASYHTGSVFYLFDPPTGQGLSLAYDADGLQDFQVGVLAVVAFYSGVDSSGFRDTDVIQGNDSRSVTSTAQSGDLVVSFAAFTANVTSSGWTGPTEILNTGDIGGSRGSYAEASPSGDLTSTFTINNGDSDMSIGAMVLKPAGGGGGGEPAPSGTVIRSGIIRSGRIGQ